jgi:hypothetical protein
MKIFYCLVISFCLTSAIRADVPPAQRGEVEHLLDYVAQSGCTMLRNGSEHQGPEAREHIQRKYDYFRDEIASTEQFIEYSATKSTMSGKYYTVRCPGQGEQRSQDWLLEELAAYRAGQAGAVH